jgi:alkylation response protein AidB-like acyl-CoA dehydrogenase
MGRMRMNEALIRLEELAGRADADAVWPSESWELLRQAGGLAWSIPTAYGGDGLEGPELFDRYERLAGACLTTAFILSQRDAAVRRIGDHGSEEVRRELLPPLASGERFATVGLSHLTTSRQHGKPALVAGAVEGGLALAGVMPWVTGAARAEYVITGAVLADGQQFLAVLPVREAGVCVEAPLDLMALAGSITSQVTCADAVVASRWMLLGPVERVLAPTSRGGTGGLETSVLALGLAGTAVDYLHAESKARPELQSTAERMEHSRKALRDRIRRFALSGSTPEDAANLRGRANAFVLRATQAALTASKGAGFLRGHPAQRWARQALFFLVWSCPRPAAEATLAYLAPEAQDVCDY